MLIRYPCLHVSSCLREAPRYFIIKKKKNGAHMGWLEFLISTHCSSFPKWTSCVWKGSQSLILQTLNGLNESWCAEFLTVCRALLKPSSGYCFYNRVLVSGSVHSLSRTVQKLNTGSHRVTGFRHRCKLAYNPDSKLKVSSPLECDSAQTQSTSTNSTLCVQ